jgi:long-chain fatty acid transport protein
MNRVQLKYLAIILSAIAFPATVSATNGYFTHGVSVAEKGIAGAGVAYSQDTLAAANNPAGMVWQGASFDVGATLFSPRREYTATGGPAPGCDPITGQCPFSIGDGDQNIESENEAFLIPHFGYNWALAEDRTIGISVYGNGGMNTEYKGGEATLYPMGPFGPSATLDGTFGDGTAGVDLSQLFVSTTYSAKAGANTSWGVSAIVAYQRFEAKGLGNFAGFSTDPGNLSNNDHDTSTGLGIRLGLQTEVSPGFRIGAAYQPKIDMSEFDDYSGLFADDGDFDIPSNFTVGLTVDVGPSGMLFLDYQQINYEDVDAVSNSIDSLVDGVSCAPGPMGGTGSGCLGGSDGAGFGWEDMQIIKLGYQWVTGKNTWRVGYSTTDQPIPDDEVVFNILAPGVVEDHFTFGFTRELNDKSSIDFAAMYAPSVSVKGDSPFDPTQEIELEMEQYELAISYSRRIE